MSKQTEKFKGEYEINDGYCGGSRPQYFLVSRSDIEEDTSDEELEELFYEIAEQSFRERIGITCQNVRDFIAWARKECESDDE